jgi:hypothetical protein
MSEATAFIPPHALNTAVLFLVFNRLDTTRQVFEAIRQAKPPRLYVAADGARANKEGEADKTQAVRDYIMQNVDWECEVKTMFRERNLGCKMAVSGAIDWFFENEEMGIILEDDCLPSQSFFWFCEELLERYKNDMRIFLISGYNKQNSWKEETNDYFFSNLGGIWGWAAWSRAWQHYDVEMNDIDDFIRLNHFENLLGRDLGKVRQKMIYDSIITKKMNTWDYQWGYTRHKNNALACVPTKSLVENIGFGDGATHTFGDNQDNVSKHEIQLPLKSNSFIVPDRKYDELFLSKSSLKTRIENKIKRLLNLRKR